MVRLAAAAADEDAEKDGIGLQAHRVRMQYL
jgi:hypothetical protein